MLCMKAVNSRYDVARRLIAHLGVYAVLALAPMLLATTSTAQPLRKAHRVAVLGAATPSGYSMQVEAFKRGLRELGYIEGKNLVLDFRWSEGDNSRLPALAAELIRNGPDVLVTSGPGALVARHATPNIPIVLAAAGNAVESGLVESLARPGGNVTGSSFFFRELNLKRLEMIRETLPRLTRLGIIVYAQNPANSAMLQAIRDAAQPQHIELQVVEAKTPADFENAFAVLAKGRAEALLVAEHTMLVAEAARIAQLARSHRLPTVGFVQIADAGGLLSFGVDFPALWHRAATFVDKILKGAKPSDLPVEQPIRFEVVVNLKAAKELGLSIPPSVLVRANRVIQ